MHYWPQQTSVGPFTTGLADYLAEQGWKVTVLTTFPHYPRWEIDEAYRGTFYRREQRGAIDIRRVWVYVPPRPKHGTTKTWKRIVYDTTLATFGLPVALTLPPQDVIVAVCPPLQVGLAAMALKQCWGAPVLYWIQDIVPDAALSTGMMREGMLLKLGRKLEKIVYNGVDTIVNISEGFEHNLAAKGVPRNKMVLLPNWANLAPFEDASLDGTQARQQHGFTPHDFVLMHAGNVGTKQAMEYVIRAMKHLEEYPDIHLVIIGEGNALDTVKNEAARLQVQRVSFLPTTATVAAFVDLLRAANVFLINQAKEVKDALLPSKLLSYLPGGRPVLAAVHAESEAGRFVQRTGCGVLVEPEAPEQLANALLDLKHAPDVCSQMGETGVHFIQHHLQRSVLLKQFEELLQDMQDTTSCKARSFMKLPKFRANTCHHAFLMRCTARSLAFLRGFSPAKTPVSKRGRLFARKYGSYSEENPGNASDE
jgi:colanic acid biosynthesis glycosyl transferase WcaI